MTVPKKYFYKTTEVAEMLGVPAPTLRYWENTFDQLDPPRTPGGMRKYRPGDVEVCNAIKYLLRDKGLSIEYARKALCDHRNWPPRRPFICNCAKDAMRLLAEAKSRSEDAHAVARIEAVEQWIAQTGGQAKGQAKGQTQ